MGRQLALQWENSFENWGLISPQVIAFYASGFVFGSYSFSICITFNLNFNNQQFHIHWKIKFSLLSISAITNKLLKLNFNAYFFVENVYRICLVNILKFILKYDIWPLLIIISSLITSYWVGEKSSFALYCKWSWFANGLRIKLQKCIWIMNNATELDHANTYEFKNYLIS
jgi:hypothetical protein